MLRRSLARLVTFAEAKKLFLAPDGTPLATPSAPLPVVLEAVQTNYRQDHHTEREALVAAAMQQVVRLDRENADSEQLANWVEQAPATAGLSRGDVSFPKREGGVGEQGGGHSDGGAKPVHTMVQLMKAFPSNIGIREICCRCIANVCQLSPAATMAAPARRGKGVALGHEAEDASAESQANVAYYKALEASYAETLVKEGALEQCLGTMAAMHRLSRKGRCWAALSVLNLVCLSRSGAARAAREGKGEEVLSEFILFLLEDGLRGGVLVDEDGLTGIALDAALGALTGILAAEAPENDKGYSYNYEKIGYTAVDALVRALLATSSLLVRDGRNNGAYNASLPNRRYGGTTNFLTASELQQQSVVTLLPLLHKGWMALQHVASHAANLPILFDTLYEAANVNQESGGRVADGDDAGDADGAAAVLEVSEHTERRYVAALTSLLEAAMFLVTELEGLPEVSPELARLQQDIALSVMEVMATMTATRKDVKAPKGQEKAKRGEYADEDADEADEEEDGVSAVLPTPAALGVTGVLASGLVSSMALATAVRLHTEQQDVMDKARQQTLTPYSTERFALLSKSLMVLSHLSEAEDEVATSANTVAALQAMLRDAVDVAKGFPFSYRGDITALFKPTAQDGADAANAADGETPIVPQHRLALMQHFALVGQIYASLYSVLRTPRGVALVTELDVPATAADMQRCLVHAYGKAIKDAQAKYGGRGEAAGSPEARTAKEEAWVPTAAEESVRRLTTLGDNLISTLAKLSPQPPPPAAA